MHMHVLYSMYIYNSSGKKEIKVKKEILYPHGRNKSKIDKMSLFSKV